MKRQETVNTKEIVDTLRIGSYFRDLKQEDQIKFSLVDLDSSRLLTSLKDHTQYEIDFFIERLKYLPLNMEILNNGSISKSEEGNHILSVNRTDEFNYMEITFQVELDNDSILIHHRNWTDSTKENFNESYTGFSGLGSFKIRIEENPSSINQ